LAILTKVDEFGMNHSTGGNERWSLVCLHVQVHERRDTRV
jgi:hypothetical protein